MNVPLCGATKKVGSLNAHTKQGLHVLKAFTRKRVKSGLIQNADQ